MPFPTHCIESRGHANAVALRNATCRLRNVGRQRRRCHPGQGEHASVGCAPSALAQRLLHIIRISARAQPAVYERAADNPHRAFFVLRAPLPARRSRRLLKRCQSYCWGRCGGRGCFRPKCASGRWRARLIAGSAMCAAGCCAIIFVARHDPSPRGPRVSRSPRGCPVPAKRRTDPEAGTPARRPQPCTHLHGPPRTLDLSTNVGEGQDSTLRWCC